jgi:CubicO group peptidase (beta-lactamase class C family)
VGQLILMRKSFLTAALAVSLLTPAGLRAQSDAPVLKLIRDYIEALRVQGGIPGLAVAVVGADQIVWEQAFGRQDIERSIPTRPDTPFHVDGLTQVFTASYLLRCVEDGRLSLDDRIGDFKSDVPEPTATIRQLLTHTSGPAANPTFQYRPERLNPLTTVVRACAVESFRGSTMNIFDRLAMRDSVPGPDAPQLVAPAEGIPSPSEKVRYGQTLERLAVPYRIDRQRRATPSRYSATTLTPGGGLISTVHDLALFDLALKDPGALLLPETLEAAWTPATGSNGQSLPHGLGWFAGTYNGERIVWQYGLGENASSALMVTMPDRHTTYILLANSPGLADPAPASVSQLVASPFVRVLLTLVVG